MLYLTTDNLTTVLASLFNKDGVNGQHFNKTAVEVLKNLTPILTFDQLNNTYLFIHFCTSATSLIISYVLFLGINTDSSRNHAKG